MYTVGTIISIDNKKKSKKYEVKNSFNVIRFLHAFPEDMDITKLKIGTKVQIIDLEDKGCWISGIMGNNKNV